MNFNLLLRYLSFSLVSPESAQEMRIKLKSESLEGIVIHSSPSRTVRVPVQLPNLNRCFVRVNFEYGANVTEILIMGFFEIISKSKGPLRGYKMTRKDFTRLTVYIWSRKLRIYSLKTIDAVNRIKSN